MIKPQPSHAFGIVRGEQRAPSASVDGLARGSNPERSSEAEHSRRADRATDKEDSNSKGLFGWGGKKKKNSILGTQEQFSGWGL